MVEAKPSRPISKAPRNARRKAFATTCNAVAVAMFVSAVLQPLMAGRFNAFGVTAALAGFIALQAFLHYIFRYMED